MKKDKNIKIRFRILFLSFGILVTILSFAIIFGAYKQLFEIEKSDWLNMLFAWIGSAFAIFLGLIAYYFTNERFKLENDLSTERSETKSEEYQNQLLSINNRLMKLEENKEYTYFAFTQEPVLVVNHSFGFKIDGKTYMAEISNTGKEFCDGTVFAFGITNQTEIPIRCFQIKRLAMEYSDYGDSKNNKKVAVYGSGCFVPSSIINKGEVVNYVLVANNVKDLAENLPDGMEISLIMTLEVISIYGRVVCQKFLIRLQRENAFFNAGNDRNIFWNYCFEDSPERVE